MSTTRESTSPKSGINTPYILGLDLGVQSVGWAVINLDEEGKPCGIRRTGVRCFESGVGSETQIEMGKDESGNTARRQARQQRRQMWRRARRLAKIYHRLQSHGLLPSGDAKTPEQRHALLLNLDKELAAEFIPTGDRVAAHLLPYRLRVAALDQLLPPFALGRAIYHLAQRRGFLSNRKAKKAGDDEGVVKAGISQLAADMEAAGARTLGEYFSRIDPEEMRIRGRWTGRQMYLDEFDKIAAGQTGGAITAETWQSLRQTIFFQRPLRSQKGLIGRCDLEPGQRRAPLAALDAQRFRYWQKITDLEVIYPDGRIVELTPEQRTALAEKLEVTGELTMAGLRNALGLKTKKGEEPYTFNLESGGEAKFLGNRTAAKLHKVLAERWQAMPDDRRAALVDEMLQFEHEDALAGRLQRAWHFDATTAAQLAAIDFEPGYAALSRQAIAKLLPRLIAGQRLNTARKEVYGDRLAESVVYDALPPVNDALRAIRNPVVCRGLTELRKVVNALLRAYGKPTTIRVELARDIKKGRKSREDAFKRMRSNEKRRIEAKHAITLADVGIAEPSRADVLKWLLAEECNWECPYTGRTITPRTLLGRSPQFDIEHILPFSKSLDNSYQNKTLCYHEENRNVKQNRTPSQAYASNNERWHEIIRRIRRFRGDAADAKLRRFQLQELPDDFASRQLNDTRYISRSAGEYLGLLYGVRGDAQGTCHVQVSTGSVTAYLRDEWNLNEILGDGGEKNRDDHRHHAVDAVAIALASAGTIHQLSAAAVRAQEIGRRLFVPIDAPWGTTESFLNEVRQSIDAITISYRVDRRVSGPLHKDSLYSPPVSGGRTAKDKTATHHIRKPLARLSADEVERIVDGAVRNCVRAKLEQLKLEPAKAFTDATNLPYLKAHDGRIVPIRRVRIQDRLATIRLGAESRRRYVAPGTNHHLEVLQVDGGEAPRWEYVVVSLYEAAQRMRSKLPVVQRDHGPGKTFLFSLAGGEYVEMADADKTRKLYRVTVISADQIEFVLHTDARPITVRKKIKGARMRCTPVALARAQARKVAIDPLGNVLPAHD